jgi:uncharacterized protein
MEFDRLTITLLVLRQDAPAMTEAEADRLQDAHMSHLADLHEAGQLLAAGPLMDDHYRGHSILNVPPEMAKELAERDPAVQAGKYDVHVMPWMVPAGAVTFSPTHFPRSMAEVR